MGCLGWNTSCQLLTIVDMELSLLRERCKQILVIKIYLVVQDFRQIRFLLPVALRK